MDNERNELLEVKTIETEQVNVQENTPEMFLPPQNEPKPLFDITKEDKTFVIFAVLAGIFTSVFGVFGGFAFGYLLSIIFMFTLFAVYFLKGVKICFSSILCGILSLCNSAIFLCTTNGSVRFFGVVVSFLLSLICFNGLKYGVAKGNRETIEIFFSSFSTLDNIGVTIKSLFSNTSGDKNVIAKVFIGLLCGIPVLLVVVPLLISSDYAFRGMMSNIFSNTFATVLKSIFGIVIAFFAVVYGISLKKDRTVRMKQSNFSGIESVYIISFLSTICLCYLLYLFSQLAYFFSAFKGFLPDTKITYAEYARKGFFEMCVIAVINIIIVFLALLIAKKQNGKVCHGIKILTTFIAIFTLIIIATAISKMVLYINEYGMTVLRITTSSFMLFLAIVFISVILRIYITKINIVKTALISAGCILLVLGTVNVNAICARYNYESYKAKRLDTIDVESLYNLGDEGIPYIVKLTNDYNSDTVEKAKKYLAMAYLYDYFDDMSDIKHITVDDLKKNRKNKGFEHFSIPKQKAYESLYNYLEKDNSFISLYRKNIEETQQSS